MDFWRFMLPIISSGPRAYFETVSMNGSHREAMKNVRDTTRWAPLETVETEMG
jgi:hypothetical protein